MSANNQILVKEYKGKWYVYENINAESWSKDNELERLDAKQVFNTRSEAIEFAHEVESHIKWPDECEYGVQLDRLAKDGADVKIIE